jgi:prevent-host-death family protein
MRKVGLFEAKQRLSELVERAEEGERIGITRRGKLAAVLVPAVAKDNLKQVFENVEKIRKKAKLPSGVSVDDLIDEGRR